MSRLTRRLKRRLCCRLLDLHVGHPECTTVETETFRARLVYLRCSRCGTLHPIDLKPLVEVSAFYGSGPITPDDVEV